MLGSLRRELRPALPCHKAIERVQERFQQREARFLDFARRAFNADPQSPVKRLLDFAGFTHQDLVNLVNTEGLESALSNLAREGVYFRNDEFKGLQPIRRGSL